MDEPEHTSRPSKRSKISPTSSPTAPLTSRAFSAVRNVVFGKRSSRTRLTSTQSFFKKTHDNHNEAGEKNGLDRLSSASLAAQCSSPAPTTIFVPSTPRRKIKASVASSPTKTNGERSASHIKSDSDLKKRWKHTARSTQQETPHTPRTKLRPETLAKLAQGQKLVRSVEQRRVENQKYVHEGEENRYFDQTLSNGAAASHQVALDRDKDNRGLKPSSQAKPQITRRCGLESPTKSSTSSDDSILSNGDHTISTERENLGRLIDKATDQESTEVARAKRQRRKRVDDQMVGSVESQPPRRRTSICSFSQPAKKVKGYVYVPVKDDRDEQEEDLMGVDGGQNGSIKSTVRRTRSSRPKAINSQPTKATIRQSYSRDVFQDTTRNGKSGRHIEVDVESSGKNGHHPKSRIANISSLHSTQIEMPRNDDPSSSQRYDAIDAQVTTEATIPDAMTDLRAAISKSSKVHIDRLKSSIISVLTRRDHIPPIGVSNQLQKVISLLRQTVLAGEGNSMLIIGPRGSGKTTLVEHAISEISDEVQETFHVIRLSGFICTDDKIALREIWRQLGQEIEELVLEDSDGPRGINYADALTRLLALLNHPAHRDEASEKHVDENSRKSTKAVIFVLDEFHLFASHTRQTLLYNLFDCAQTSSAPIAVLGLSTKLNLAEMLEKRVKSRFSQRQVVIGPPKTLQAFKELCSAALIPPYPSMSKPTFAAKLVQRQHVHDGEQAYDDLRLAWASYVSACLFVSESDPEFAIYLAQLFARPSAVSLFQATALLPITCIGADQIPIGQSFLSMNEPSRTHANAHTIIGVASSPPDSKLPLLSCLSILEMSLVICTARTEIVLDSGLATATSLSSACTFDTVYLEYLDLATRAKVINTASPFKLNSVGASTGRVFSKKIAKGAWENLCKLGILTVAGSTSRVGSVLPAGSGHVWRCEVALEEIACIIGTGTAWGGSGAILARWCREL